jgi:quinol monooxygenase YgiN
MVRQLSKYHFRDETSTASELNATDDRRRVASGPQQPMENIMKCRGVTPSEPITGSISMSRRLALGAFCTTLATASLSPFAISQSRSEIQGAMKMSQYAVEGRTLNDAVNGGGLLVVAQWEAGEGNAERIAAILGKFLPEAQREAGVKLFLIGRGRENPAQFMFYELFRDEAAFKAHQDSAHFKTYIAGEALPLLAKRERAQYTLI